MPGRRYAPCQQEASGTLLRAVGMAARGSGMSWICRKGWGLEGVWQKPCTGMDYCWGVLLRVPQVKTKQLDVSGSVGPGLDRRALPRFFSSEVT